MIKFKMKYIIVILLVIFMSLSSSLVLARAGGGSTSGGSTSGGSSSSHTHSHRSRYPNWGYEEVSPLGNLIIIITMFLVGGSGSIIFAMRVYKKQRKSKKLIRQLKRIDKGWNYNDIEKRVKEAFYIIQNAWCERNQDIARDYMSDRIYELHSNKTNWMIIKNQKNILKDVYLLDIKPVCVKDFLDDSKDAIWFYIKASMVDYTIDEITMEIIEGNSRREKFVEYWKFIRGEHGWVLDEILQEDEFQTMDLLDSYSEKLKK